MPSPPADTDAEGVTDVATLAGTEDVILAATDVVTLPASVAVAKIDVVGKSSLVAVATLSRLGDADEAVFPPVLAH